MIAGTKYSTPGLRRITRPKPQVRVRLFGFALILVCGGTLISWMTISIWSQLDRLQREHAAVQSESFYLGVHLRGAIRGLNDKLLQIGLSHDPGLVKEFLEESAALKGWISTNRMHLAHMENLRLVETLEVARQVDILNQAQIAYEGYLTNAAAMLGGTEASARPYSFELIYKKVRENSQPLFPLCDELVKAQREGFGEFLAETQKNLINHQRLLKFLSASILGLALALTFMVYRGMIAPLRAELTESSLLIERQHKLASLGVLASGVAHELRNPLTAIKIRLFSLRTSIPALEQNEDAVLIGDEINRLERIVKDFLQFAKPSEPHLAKIPAARILKEIQTLLHPQLERVGIELQVQNHEPVWIHADAQQLEQVLLNLIQNSAENIGRNGTIRLGLRRELAELDGRTRPVVVVGVTDTGKGIPPEVQPRLFDPFFTTKEGGTGLGLAIAARIVEKHGGMLRYETEMGRGTTFDILLPAVESDATEYTADRR
jgi:signal transduction histidine kinase